MTVAQYEWYKYTRKSFGNIKDNGIKRHLKGYIYRHVKINSFRGFKGKLFGFKELNAKS